LNKISVVIIAKNEEDNLPRCLRSIDWVDEIILIDSGSTDDTVQISLENKASVFHIEWQGFGHAKKFGVDKCRNNWILSIDADEEVTGELKEEIQTVLSSENNIAGYYIPRRTQFLGRWVYHCGWYPDYILRLFRKDAGNFNNNLVHEGVELKGMTVKLQNELLHYSYLTLEDYLSKFNRYTTLAAQTEYDNGRSVSVYDIVVRPFAALIKHYIIKRGFLDGVEGFLISILSSCYVMVKYAKLRNLYRTKKIMKDNPGE